MVEKDIIKVLIVEDEEIVSKMLKFYIEKYKTDKEINTTISISLASNGWEALGMSSVEDYDIILLDVMMPKLDGMEFLQSLRKVQKIISVLSANNFDEYKETLVDVTSRYSTFLNSFSHFYEIASILYMLNENIHKFEIDVHESEDREFIIEVIIGILQDLHNWKQNVFVSQDAVDVFYINASIYDSCMSLKEMIEAKL